MRIPTLTIVSAAVLSTALVNASPLPQPGSYNSNVYAVSSPGSAPNSASSSPSPHLHPVIGTKVAREPSPDHSPSIFTVSKLGPRELLKRALDAFTAGGNVDNGEFVKRTTDDETLGGNAYTGNSGPVDGGSIVNQGNNFGTPTLMNMNSNNAGDGGESTAGCAIGGHGNDRGPGGNAHSGDPGSAVGGSVWNSGAVMNIDSNNAGKAGESRTGCATGGDVSDLSAA
ncbi:hypothetical protein L227DRAFT_609021 [Lentinus tigrinus ALCF2SS1-6]|uniref:Uncharacterized protein n=1 Tax=Lentinus tigrinus ALCF2SS1-6 TaxID=1328759 RepID=A0A5C2SHB0_9APHY|nr:hypothetical protein L227DRAFT_609021 [Lentinus tigrinus ALCF2SS1-6]